MQSNSHAVTLEPGHCMACVQADEGMVMAFMSGDLEYVAGNLAAEPRLQRFPAENDMYDEVLWLTVAVNHSEAATEYVELEARGKTKEYIKNLISSPANPLGKGAFVMAGGRPAASKSGKKKLRLAVFSSETSLNYDVLDWDRIRQDAPADQ